LIFFFLQLADNLTSR